MAAPQQQDAHAHAHAPCDETTPLVPGTQPVVTRTQTARIVPAESVHRVLPLALSASVAMAATAATSVYAYAVILCKDPTRCEDREQKAYAGAVAVATAIAHVCNVLALGPLQHLMAADAKSGLFFWIATRSLNAVMLCVAVIYNNIYIAFAGRIFEGLAADNLLHYILASIFASATTTASGGASGGASDGGERFSRLLGTSLALYMVGMALSPAVAGLLPDFFMSFVMALAVFAASAAYLAFSVPVVVVTTTKTETEIAPLSPESESRKMRKMSALIALVRPLSGVFRQLAGLCRERRVLLVGVSLLAYNTAQAYLFPALMVYASGRFGFTGRQNGFVLSVAAAVSAVYLLVVLYVVPRWQATKRDRSSAFPSPAESDRPKQHNSRAQEVEVEVDEEEAQDDDRDEFEDNNPTVVTLYKQPNRDFPRAILSLLVPLATLPCIPLATAAWQIFPLTAFLALGLAAPSFLKAHGVALAQARARDGDDYVPTAVAGLALMESVGGLLAPVVLGAWQSGGAGDGGGESVFLAAAGLVAVAVFAVVGSRVF